MNIGVKIIISGIVFILLGLVIALVSAEIKDKNIGKNVEKVAFLTLGSGVVFIFFGVLTKIWL
jgi:hypothetical protein